MSIDARIAAVTIIVPSYCEICKGTGKDPEDSWDDCPTCHGATKEQPKLRLKLEPREKGGLAGQSVLTVVNPPTLDPKMLSGLIGTEIWGNANSIMVGDVKWADRIGYTKIRLV